MYVFPTTMCGTRRVSRDSSNTKPLLSYLALDNPYNNSTALVRREIEQVFCKQVDRGLRSQSVLGMADNPQRVQYNPSSTISQSAFDYYGGTVCVPLPLGCGALSDVSRRNVGSTKANPTRPNVNDDH